MDYMDLEKFPESETARRMLSSVSDGFYDQSYVGKWLFQVMGAEMEEAGRIVEELPYQAFPETATWGLPYHERKWGLPVREDLGDEKRRAILYEKRDIRRSITPFTLERLLRSLTDFKVSVSDANDMLAAIHQNRHPNVFDVILEGAGTPEIADIRELLDRVKQSHTLYDLIYYEPAAVKSDTAYQNRIQFRSGFYPRFNLAYRLMDGVWRLDGTIVLNGYNSGERLEFYPVHLCCTAEALQKSRARPHHILIGVESEALMKTQAGLDIRSTTHKTLETAGRVNCQTEVFGKPSTASFMTKMNQMDACWMLDGNRKLDGGTYCLQ